MSPKSKPPLSLLSKPLQPDKLPLLSLRSSTQLQAFIFQMLLSRMVEGLTKANWPQLNPSSNSIGERGCQQLAGIRIKGQSNLHQRIQLKGQLLPLGESDEANRCLDKANWPQLQKLNLIDAKVGVKGCQDLAKAHWPQPPLRWNGIGEQGYRCLRTRNWEVYSGQCHQ